MSIFRQVKATIKKYGLLSTGDKVLVAVSGGPDSLALLHMLKRLEEQYDLTLYVAHLNHKLRGEAAKEDALFVKQKATNLGLNCFIKEADVAEYQKQEGLSAEAAGRKLRYDFFFSLLAEHNCNKLALGHHANDQAETLLIKFLRGSGLQGLKGILPQNKQLIRPLIDLKRSAIEAYCSKHQLKPRLDESNLEAIYLRNKIRLELLPLLKAEYNNNIVETLKRSAELLRADNQYLTKQAKKRLKAEAEIKEDRVTLSRSYFLDLELALQRRVLREIFKLITGNYKDFYYTHIEDIISFIKEGGTGKKIDLPCQLKLYLSYGSLIFTKNSLLSKDEFFKYQLSLGEHKIKEQNLVVKARVVSKDYPWQKRVKERFSACFDYAKIGESFYLRQRKAGDRFYPLNLGGSKKVKDFLIDQKVPKFLRDQISVFVTEDDQIFWLAGYRTDDRFKIRDETENILIIELENIEGGKL